MLDRWRREPSAERLAKRREKEAKRREKERAAVFEGSSTFPVGLHGCGPGIEFPGHEVDHRDVVAVGAITTGSAFGGLDE